MTKIDTSDRQALQAVIDADLQDTLDEELEMELDDSRLGFLVARHLNPQKCRLLLQILLANGVHDPVEQQQAFDFD